MKLNNKLCTFVNASKAFAISALAAVALSAFSSGASAQAIDLGTAVAYSTLSLQNPNSFTQQAVTDALNAGTFVDNLSSSSSFATSQGFTLDNTTYTSSGISGSTTIAIGSTGKFIFDISSFNLTNATLIINAPTNAKVVLDVSGAFLMSGGKIELKGGITAKNILLDLSGTSGGAALISGGAVNASILAPHRDVVIQGNATIKGKVIAQTVSLGGGVTIVSPDY